MANIDGSEEQELKWESELKNQESVLLGGSDPLYCDAEREFGVAAATAVKARSSTTTIVYSQSALLSESIADRFERVFAAKMARVESRDPFDRRRSWPVNGDGLADLDRDVKKTVDRGGF